MGLCLDPSTLVMASTAIVMLVAGGQRRRVSLSASVCRKSAKFSLIGDSGCGELATLTKFVSVFYLSDEDYAVAVELVLPHTLVFHLRV
jgi:hypothetical protein